MACKSFDRAILTAPFSLDLTTSQDLQLPADPNLIVSVHFYEPFAFTHQGAEWVVPSPAVPTSWDADQLGFGGQWQNWSWDTDISFASEQLTATFARQWAGLNFGRNDAIDPATLNFEASGQATLQIVCGSVATDAFVPIEQVQTTASTRSFSIDVRACPSQTNNIAFQVASPTFETITLASAEVCDASGNCQRLIETGLEALEGRFDQAQQWGETNNRPINVGEFGAYGANGRASLSERVEWTAAVRQAAAERDMSMSYWEFGAGFGVYDRSARAWVAPLLNALDPAGVGPAPMPPLDLGSCNGQPATINMALNGGDGTGTSGDDVIIGTAGPDTISAGAGNDVICAGGGDDRVFGGIGDDDIFGDSGNDRLIGDAGDDEIWGQGDNDLLIGADGNDVMRGGGGNDISYGGNGNDTLRGGAGDDILVAQQGNDSLYGFLGNDRLDGGGGNDRLNGSAGTDTCNGNTGTDIQTACEFVLSVP